MRIVQLVLLMTLMFFASSAMAAFTIYMAPADSGGSDSNDGLTPATAVTTLRKVQLILLEHRPDADVEVRIKQGSYIASELHWRFYIPGHTISFMPIDYQYGDGLNDIAGLPVFQNALCGSSYCGGYWIQMRLPTSTVDPMYNGGNSGLRFYYLRVQYYPAGGVSIYGNSGRDAADDTYNPPLHVPATNGINGNKFFGMQFHKLGNKWAVGAGYGYGAIVLNNSSNNQIHNNHFINIENIEQHDSYIHGLYITHSSSHNSIEGNNFNTISGDPIKVRDKSNYNTIEHNKFTRTGLMSYFRDEFCDLQCAIDHETTRQCASYHNRFFYNEVNSGYHDGHLSNWSLNPLGLTYAGGAGCSIPPGDQRIYTGYNTSS